MIYITVYKDLTITKKNCSNFCYSEFCRTYDYYEPLKYYMTIITIFSSKQQTSQHDKRTFVDKQQYNITKLSGKNTRSKI